MKSKNQILLIENFFLPNEETILINQVNEELGVLYLSIIKYYADKEGVKLNINDGNETTGNENDLFGLKEIKILNITNTKKLTEILNTNNKKIIFTDYKNFKKLNSKYNCINGYKFELDIAFFIKNELKINNDELIFFCINNPALIISETSKFLINNQYACDQSLIEEKNHILNIRKSIFKIKSSNLNIKNLYLNLKEEAKYKKFSFLTY